MDKLFQLKAQYGVAVDELQTLYDKPKAFEAKHIEITNLQGIIKRAEAAQELARGMAKPANSNDVDDKSKFKNIGELLKAVADHYSGGRTDPRLVRAPFGMGETDPSAGGFPINTDFANTILTRAYDMGEILSRVFKLPIGANFNGIKIPGIDEQNRATGSRWGGVRTQWVAEGDAVPASAPKFRLIELDLKKLLSSWVMTDELLADTTALTGIANQAFSEEIQFVVEDAVIRGTGSGMPTGLLNSLATITVAPEKSQTPGTFLWENALNMWMNTWARSRSNMVWLINQELEPQIYQLRQVVGTGGVPVWIEPGGAKNGGGQLTMLGRPVIPVEYCEAPGTPGDIILCDLSQYVLIDKNEMQQMSSIHVRFLTDEMTFRLTYRVDGQSIWHTQLTPYKGTQKRSPFVILGQR